MEDFNSDENNSSDDEGNISRADVRENQQTISDENRNQPVSHSLSTRHERHLRMIWNKRLAQS